MRNVSVRVRLRRLLEEDPRFRLGAYQFVQEALTYAQFALKMGETKAGGAKRGGAEGDLSADDSSSLGDASPQDSAHEDASRPETESDEVVARDDDAATVNEVTSDFLTAFAAELAAQLNDESANESSGEETNIAESEPTGSATGGGASRESSSEATSDPRDSSGTSAPSDETGGEAAEKSADKPDAGSRPRPAGRKRRRGRGEKETHLSGRELCEAVRQYALQQYGFLARQVLANWGINSTSDLGEIVYNLIRIDVFKKSPSDRREDFNDVYDFVDAFQYDVRTTE